jgi:hypothetical protein
MSAKNGNSEVSGSMSNELIRLVERLDKELSELPIETHHVAVNMLQQTAAWRLAMIQREEKKKEQEAQRRAQFGIDPSRRQ